MASTLPGCAHRGVRDLGNFSASSEKVGLGNSIFLKLGVEFTTSLYKCSELVDVFHLLVQRGEYPKSSLENKQ